MADRKPPKRPPVRIGPGETRPAGGESFDFTSLTETGPNQHVSVRRSSRLPLLLAVEFHGGIGLYRLAVKWGWFDGCNPRRNRIRLKRFMWGMIGFLLVLGMMSLAAYIKIGQAHAEKVGEHYSPPVLQQPINQVEQK